VTNKGQNQEYLQSVDKLHLKDPERMKSVVIEAELYQNQLIEAEANNGDRAAVDSFTSPKKVKIKEKRSK
jgi:hypothetical protein